MGFFRNFRISTADKKVQMVVASYLNNLGALPMSQEFVRTVEELISIFWGDIKKRQVCEENGFNKADLCHLFISMVIAVLPNPVIQSGGSLLVATLPFIEFHRLEAMMSGANNKTKDIHDPEERRRIVAERAKVNAEMIYTTHLHARGPAKLVGQGAIGNISQVADTKVPEPL